MKNKFLLVLWQLISPYMIISYFLILAFYINPMFFQPLLFNYIALLIIPIIVFQIIHPRFQKNKIYKLSIIIAFTIILLIKEPQFETENFKLFLKILYLILLLNFILSFSIFNLAELFSLGAFITFIFYFLQFYSIDPFIFLVVSIIYSAILFFELTKNETFTYKELLLAFVSGILTVFSTFSIANLLY